MGSKTIVAAAALAISATIASAATANANPARPTPNAPEVVGTDHGIGFTATVAADRHSVVETIDSGAFRLADNGRAITVIDSSNIVVGTAPTTVELAGRRLALTPTISHAGKTLTLTAVELPQSSLEPISSQDRWNAQLQRASFGALLGAGIGLIGLAIFVIPAIVTVPLGALIGFLAVGGQPLIDAGLAYFSGQP